MGQQDSKQIDIEQHTPHDFVNRCQEVCKNEDIEEFKKLWGLPPYEQEQYIKHIREETYMKSLLGDNILEEIKKAFRSQKLEWRRAGIEVARTFFHVPEARRKLVRADFIGSVLLITLPEAQPHQDDTQQELTLDEKKRQKDQEEELQLLAANTFCEMAQHPDFLEPLCTTSVLNFLCIVLNQVPKAQGIVTETFVQLSNDKENLVVLMEGAMGDILETFFKTVDFEKPLSAEDKQALEQWRTRTIALSNTSQALAQLIKYNHPCQVDTPTIVKVFTYSLAIRVDETKKDITKIAPMIDITGLNHMPDNIQLLAELSQLFYWKCRTVTNTSELMTASAPRELNLDGDSGLDFVIRVLVAMWKRCVDTHLMLAAIDEGNDKKDAKVAEGLRNFCVDDLDRLKPLDLNKEEDAKAFKEKKQYANMRLCYLNCTLWVLLPIRNLRWKLRDFGLEQMHLAFTLTDEAYLTTILTTVRYLVDLPPAQESSEFIMFFGKQLLILLDQALNEKIKSQKVINVLLDAMGILAMGRDMQEMLAKYNIHSKLKRLTEMDLVTGDANGDANLAAINRSKVELAVLRCLAEVAIHPSHRLKWVDKDVPYDEEKDAFKKYIRDDSGDGFQAMLQSKLQQSQADADNFKTLASLLLTIFREDKFKRSAGEIESMFRSVSDWWLGNSTARFDGGQPVVGTEGNQNVVRRPKIDLEALLVDALRREEQQEVVTVRETEKLCAPHECVIVLSLFSRLALEPKFKILFMKHDGVVLDALLGCVCAGIWAEAREAAATLANLMWLPDLKEEGLVCWLKLDGPRCVTVDGSNVLLPIKTGHPRGVDIGKGMYKSSWGIEFVEGSSVTLHPRGLKTHQIPGMLTTASPLHTFKNTSQKYYDWFTPDESSDIDKWFTITCWFYWPLPRSDEKRHVLLHSTPSEDGGSADPGKPLIYVEVVADDKTGKVQGKWILMGQDGNPKRLNTPDINPGWHMLSVVCSTDSNPDHPFNGTKFYLDEWPEGGNHLKDMWIPNDFYTVGNSPTHRQPFGLVTDFRIYSRVLKEQELKMMVCSRDTELHPDRLARELAKRNAADILAQRLDVPDSAAECLRALGSLATLSSQRAKIFSVCGRRVLQLIDSPLPMIQRQAARLINNIT